MPQDFTIIFRGVRGSLPVPGPSTLKIGGNSSCVQVDVLGHTVFLDAGTGIVAAGQQMAKNFFAHKEKLKRLSTTVLISHTHHDHIMGLPFFPPLYLPDSELYIYGPSVYGPVQHAAETNLEHVLAMMMDQMFFPIDLKETNSIKRIHTLNPSEQVLLSEGLGEPQMVEPGSKTKPSTDGKVVISQYRSYSHPKNGTLVYKIQCAGKSIVYATDIEGYVDGDRRLINFAKGADLLIHDTQYFAEQYTGPMPLQGFGHSTVEMATQVAKEAGVKQLALYHHDPNHDDATIAKKEEAAKKLFPNSIAAYEGLVISV
ncbi:MAG: MBL fold metallo-hydrolase [bacterium]